MNNVKVKKLLGSFDSVYNNQTEKNELYNTTEIDDLWFSARITNILHKHNIKIIGDLLKFSEIELFRLQNLGRKSLNEIKETLGLYGVNLPKKKNKYFTFKGRSGVTIREAIIPEKTVTLTDNDIKLLITQTCKSFMNDFYNRFEKE